jgi:hypothetical protein
MLRSIEKIEKFGKPLSPSKFTFKTDDDCLTFRQVIGRPGQKSRVKISKTAEAINGSLIFLRKSQKASKQGLK